MSEKKYSVIIPVYNSEKTLKRCLDSLLSQGREDAEIIIVNDGSSDRSEQLIAGYLQNNPGILYLKQTNKGVSSARNHGLEKASGQYITFVDSDDFVADTYFQELDRMGGIQDADLIMFSQKTVGGPGENEAVLYQKLARMQDRAEILELLLSSRKIMTPWNKRFKRSLIERYHIRFQKRMQTGEDFNFCLAYAVCCGSLAVVDSKIYCVDISDRKSLSRRYRPNLDQLLSDVFVTAAKTVRGSRLGTSEKARLLRVIDYLFTKNVFTCIAEEFKVSRPDYRKDKERAEEICRQFRKKLCRKGEYYGVVHFALRLMIRCRMTFLMYQVASVVKGRAFGVYAEEQCFMSRIKILIVAGAMDVGGIENQLMHLLRNADREKFQIDYTSTMEHAYYRDEIERLGGQYILCRIAVPFIVP